MKIKIEHGNRALLHLPWIISLITFPHFHTTTLSSSPAISLQKNKPAPAYNRWQDKLSIVLSGFPGPGSEGPYPGIPFRKTGRFQSIHSFINKKPARDPGS